MKGLEGLKFPKTYVHSSARICSDDMTRTGWNSLPGNSLYCRANQPQNVVSAPHRHQDGRSAFVCCRNLTKSFQAVVIERFLATWRNIPSTCEISRSGTVGGASDDPWKIIAADTGRKLKRQLACKPGSVRPGSPKTARRGDHSSWMDVAVHLTQPTRMTGLETAPRVAPRAIPIRSCSRWGLPCRFCYQSRGGLLPHPFTLTRHAGRYSFCGTFPGVAPAGR